MKTWLNTAAELQGIPLRTLEQVRADLTEAKAREADDVMASLMLRHGRLTDEAREYVARQYPGRQREVKRPVPPTSV